MPKKIFILLILIISFSLLAFNFLKIQEAKAGPADPGICDDKVVGLGCSEGKVLRGGCAADTAGLPVGTKILLSSSWSQYSMTNWTNEPSFYGHTCTFDQTVNKHIQVHLQVHYQK